MIISRKIFSSDTPWNEPHLFNRLLASWVYEDRIFHKDKAEYYTWKKVGKWHRCALTNRPPHILPASIHLANRKWSARPHNLGYRQVWSREVNLYSWFVIGKHIRNEGSDYCIS